MANEIDKLDIVFESTDKGVKKDIDSLSSSLNELKQSAERKVNETIPEQVGKQAEDAVSKVEKFTKAMEEGNKASSKTLNEPKTSTSREVDDSTASMEKNTEAVRENAKANETLPYVYNNVSGRLNELVKQANNATSAHGKLISVMGSMARNTAKMGLSLAALPFTSVYNASKRLHTAFGRLFSQIKRVAMYRLIRTALKQITAGFREGTANAYQFSLITGGRLAPSLDMIATSSLYLKNSLGAMVSPLINAVAPAIDFVVDKFVNLLNIVNQVIARLTGASTWTKAVKYPTQFAEAADTAAGAARNLQKELITILGIDEINPLEGANDRGNGSGSGGAGGLDYSSMFEEVELEKNIFSKFFDPFEQAWQSKGKGVMDSIQNALSGMRNLSDALKTSFWDVWTNGTGQKSIEHILGIFTGISNTIGNIANQFAKGWKTDNLGTKIIQNLWDILNDVLGMWDRIANATADWAKNLNFTPVIRAFENLTDSIEPVVKAVTDGLAWAWENVLLPLGSWTIEVGVPGTLDAIAAAFDAIYSVIKDLKEPFLTVWNNILKPIGQEFGKAAETVLNGIATDFERMKAVFDSIKMPDWLKSFLGIGGSGNKGSGSKSKIDWASIIMGGIKAQLGPGFDTIVDGLMFKNALSSWFGGGSNGATTGFTMGAMGNPMANYLANTPYKMDIEGVITKIDERKLTPAQKFVNGMVALLTGKDERFSKTTGTMTALLGLKDERFSKTTGNMTANLTSKREGFSLITAAMTALLSYKSEKFGMTTGGMTALLAYALDKIPNKDRYVTGVIAYLKSLERGYGFTGITLYGEIYGQNSSRPYAAFREKGGVLKQGKWHDIPQYSEGTVNAGSLFFAGENGAGPELVGHVGGRTEVLNQSQLAAAMAASMAQANASQNQLLAEQNALLRQIASKDSSVVAVLSTASFQDGANRKNRRDGRTMIPVGV